MSDEHRLQRLSIHYSNAIRYGRRLEEALARIEKAAERGGIERIRHEVRAALETPKPPHPLKNFYKDGIHTGHPHPEYLELPGTAYTDPDA